MASKINSRLKSEKARSGKPYDRPKQSLLGKVASAVKNVLVPSWFLNVPSWGNSSEEETVPAPTQVEPEDQDEVAEPVSETCTSKPAKRLRYAPENPEVTDVARPRQGTFFPPSMMNDSLSARVEREAPQVTQNCELEKKEPQLIVNGDDHSENSEGTASTSGCSSLISSHVDKPDHHFSSIKLSENALENLRKELKGKSFLRQKKDAAVSTENSFSSPCSRSGSQADLSLWSRDSSLSMRNTFRPQATFQGSRPSFNLSSFGGPSMANSPLVAKGKVSSPFYEGKTTYGGASAYRRAQLSSLPYQSSRTLQNKITVKPSNAGEDFQCMSSAAKRILNTLEKMSTPLTDVKKIPNVRQSPADISASFTPASQRLNSGIPTPRRSVSASPYTKGLPASSISTASRLNLMKNFSKISKNSKMEIPVHERSKLSLDYPTQPTVSDNETSKGGGGGGKIRTKINQHLHKSSKTSEAIEMPAEVHLPNIPLPITDLPEIKFTATEKPKISVPEENQKTPSPKDSVSFTFANPLDKSPPTVAVQPQQTFSGPAFTFSSPIVANETHTTSAVSSKVTADKDKVENNVDKQKESELYTGSVNDFLKTLRDSNQKSVEKNNSEKESRTYSNTYRASKELLEPVDSGFGDKFKPQTGTWECSSCFVRNEATADKCVCCSVSKSKPQESADKQQLKTSFGFGDKFKPPPGSWECISCLVRNKADDKRCVSCESENPNISKDSGQDTKFGSNTAKVEKPDSSKIQNKTFSDFNFSTAGTWECDACLVRNPVGKSRCVACETPKLDPKSSSAGSKSNFTAPTGSTGFRFGSLVANPVPTAGSSPFLCTVASEKSKPQSSVTFGSTTLPVTTAEGFKFNPPTPVTSAESGGFKFGVPVSDTSLKPSEGLFKIESPASKADRSFISGNSSTPTPCFTFGNLNSNHKDTSDHSKTVTTEISEETEHKSETETVPKSNILASVAPTVQLLPKPSPQFPSNTSSVTSISNTQCSSNTITTAATTNTTTTTTASSGIISSGFVFGNNNLQSQSTTTFPFGNKTDKIKTSSCAVSSAQTTTVFTSTAASGSVSLPSPFMFSSEPSKQFASSETAPVKIPADSSHGMTQETPVELQSAAEVNSTNSLSFSSSTTSQPTNFVFGTTSNAPAATSTKSSLFKFSGTTASSTAESTPKSSGIFTFGVPATTEIKEPKPAFPFASATSEEKPQTLPQPQFTFSAFKPDSSNPVATSTSAATSSPFRFGATTTPAPSTGGFVFGTPKPDVSQTASSPFTFGTGVAAKPLSNSNFGAFSQNQPVTTASVPSFNFGMTTTNPAPVGGGFNVPSSNPSSLFTFGAKTSQSTPNPVNNTGAIANPGSVFGSPASQSVFSNSTPIPSFGKQPEQKQETPSGFSFGGSTSSQTPVFRFGSNVPDGPLEKRRAAAPVPSGGGFNFAVPQPNAMNNNSMSFNPTTPPTFNFGAMPAGAPLFQFNASTESTSAPNTGPRKYRKAVRRNVRKPE